MKQKINYQNSTVKKKSLSEVVETTSERSKQIITA